MKRSLNIIGSGNVGKSLGFLLAKSERYYIQQILSRSIETSQTAQNFIKEGYAVSSYEDLSTANGFMISVKDDQLQNAVSALLKSNCLAEGTLVFHCSGALSHKILLPLKEKGCEVASIHPIKSFSNPSQNVRDFAGTYCTIEGDDNACKILQQDFIAIGANVIPISEENKIFYHIATIFSSNYFVTLFEVSLQLLEKSGIARDNGLLMLEPLLLGTLAQIKEKGTAEALTGPIARGDFELVQKQIDALKTFDDDMGSLYCALAKETLKLTLKKCSPDEILVPQT